jgi:hypothetical protein
MQNGGFSIREIRAIRGRSCLIAGCRAGLSPLLDKTTVLRILKSMSDDPIKRIHTVGFVPGATRPRIRDGYRSFREGRGRHQI